MTKFARGLQLEVTDRTDLKLYIKENTFDPSVHFETWMPDEVPETVVIVEYYDESDPYYKCLDKHINGEVSEHYWSESLIRSLLETCLLENTNEYDVEFVKTKLNQ